MALIEIIFIRHGEASNAWGDHPDPGLSENGHLQSADLLKHKELQNLEDFCFISSPKSRALMTASPLEQEYKKDVQLLASTARKRMPWAAYREAVLKWLPESNDMRS